jgi:DNA-binding FrmR family transcriptional regulator
MSSLTTSSTNESSVNLTQIQTQLKRISGQINGINKMLDEQRPCLEIVNQVLAARNSLSTVGKKLLTSELSRCARNNDQQQLETILQQLLKY